jgi:hypothetical protein
MLQNDPPRLQPFHFDADPDPAFHFDADPDPTFHSDADPYPDPASQNNADPCGSGSATLNLMQFYTLKGSKSFTKYCSTKFLKNLEILLKSFKGLLFYLLNSRIGSKAGSGSESGMKVESGSATKSYTVPNSLPK